LADCNSGLAWHGFKSPAEALPIANAAALRAIEIDPQSAEAHASLGLVLTHRWDWAGAEAEFKQALRLDPRYANAHHWYGDYLSIMGRHDEALLEARQALELDPLNLMIGTWVGRRYYLAGKYDLAIEQGRNTEELDANFAAAHLLLGENYVQVGLHDQGLAELQTAAVYPETARSIWRRSRSLMLRQGKTPRLFKLLLSCNPLQVRGMYHHMGWRKSTPL
jgi:tetratricopeptide (TPR) repeat protein